MDYSSMKGQNLLYYSSHAVILRKYKLPNKKLAHLIMMPSKGKESSEALTGHFSLLGTQRDQTAPLEEIHTQVRGLFSHWLRRLGQKHTGLTCHLHVSTQIRMALGDHLRPSHHHLFLTLSGLNLNTSS
jgi:hypothetical protein